MNNNNQKDQIKQLVSKSVGKTIIKLREKVGHEKFDNVLELIDHYSKKVISAACIVLVVATYGDNQYDYLSSKDKLNLHPKAGEIELYVGDETIEKFGESLGHEIRKEWLISNNYEGKTTDYDVNKALVEYLGIGANVVINSVDYSYLRDINKDLNDSDHWLNILYKAITRELDGTIVEHLPSLKAFLEYNGFNEVDIDLNMLTNNIEINKLDNPLNLEKTRYNMKVISNLINYAKANRRETIKFRDDINDKYKSKYGNYFLEFRETDKDDELLLRFDNSDWTQRMIVKDPNNIKDYNENDIKTGGVLR